MIYIDFYSPDTALSERLARRPPTPKDENLLIEYIHIKTRQSIDELLDECPGRTVEHVVRYGEVTDKSNKVLADLVKLGHDLDDEDASELFGIASILCARDVTAHLTDTDRETCEHYSIPWYDDDGIGVCVRVAFSSADAAMDFRRRAGL